MIENLAIDREVFTSNVFLVEGERTALVDVGNDFDVVAAVEAAGVDLDVVVLTHTHPDHVGNLEAVRAATDAPVLGFDGEFEGVDERLGDGETVRLGDHEYRALHTPGHKDDHLCLYAAEPGILFAGDLVFAGGSFGRTDLAEGDRGVLIDSIDRVCDAVDEDLAELHVGHGPSVTEDPYRHLEMAGQAART
ncbi:MBL fold metallo-hydrolase [Halomicrobium urmianum]|uniref:MBL fold metallo-hydrolase n=1 Tax=Halomicrobium urmianum TaxID=1586233 RepID=UPI001CD99EBD|nr:MBL fold metallo-hydrolase [Halomicrobium urmianum]